MGTPPIIIVILITLVISGRIGYYFGKQDAIKEQDSNNDN